ncbi:MAG: hypothetical protein ABI346_03555 [Candidatus Baltobacteraceae bacterium]
MWSIWRDLAIGLTLASLVGLVVSWRVLLQPGVVGLVHDWSIFPFREQNVALLAQLWNGWTRAALGAPVVYPTEYPLRLLLALVSLLGVSGSVVSKAVVFGAPAAAFASAMWLGRSLGYRTAATWICGALYALDPVMLNKLISGQAGYLVGYAVLPLVLATLLAPQTRRHPFIGGAALGGILSLATIELQIGIVSVALLLAFALLAPRALVARRLQTVAIAIAVLVVVETPTAVGVWTGVSGIESSDVFRHRVPWLVANSVAPWDALRLIGYLTHYDVQSLLAWTPIWNVAAPLVVIASAAGLLVAPKIVRLSALVTLPLAFALMCGAKIPFLAVLVVGLFERVTPMQIFRELYHLMIVPSLYYALAFGALADWCLRRRSPLGTASTAVLAALVLAYTQPILGGDLSGWLAPAPYDRYLAGAFEAQRSGPGRVAWFPLDQPLGYESRGAGVDPMAVTSRGSLWQYSLSWPLTALDMEARGGDTAAVRNGLRALGVGEAVERDRFYSRFDDYAPAHPPQRAFWTRPIALGNSLGTRTDYGAAIRGYRIAGAVDAKYVADRFALAPRRFALVATLAASKLPTFSYGQELPASVPFDAYVDVGDEPYEALQYDGQHGALPSWRIDPRLGFAGGDLWWWYRRSYAEAPEMSLVIGRGSMAIPVSRTFASARAVVAWIATPAGGKVEVRCGRYRTVFDTGGGWGAWRSRVLPCGALARGDRLVLASLNEHAEVAIRAVTIVESTGFDRARTHFASLIRRANRIIPLSDSGSVRWTRAGTGARLPAVPEGSLARLVLLAKAPAAGELRLLSDDHDLVAWRPLTSGGEIRVPFFGTGERLRIEGVPARDLNWRLQTLVARPVRVSAAKPGSIGRLVVAPEAFDDGWQSLPGASHLSTALGTNAFVLERTVREAPDIFFAYAPWYRLAFVLGTLVLAFALASFVALGPRHVI